MEPKKAHKEIALKLKEKFGDNARVIVYRDNNDENPIPIGEFGKINRFYSTIGSFEEKKKIPSGLYEFCAIGKNKWLPNAIVSSIYWLKTRNIDDWPLVCEDVIQINAKSTYRHMAFIPSDFSLVVSSGQEIKWLLGIPIKDNEISISINELIQRCSKIYPDWLIK